MCLSVPAKVIELDQRAGKAKVDYLGSVITVGITLLEHVEPGEFVLVHAREAIQVIDGEKALDSISLWKEMLGQE